MKPILTTDLVSATIIWDSTDDDTTVFMVAIKDEEDVAKIVYFEESSNAGMKVKYARAFTNSADAAKYKKTINNNNLIIAKSSIGYVAKSCNRIYSKKKSAKEIYCVLTVMDVYGKMHEVDIIYSNSILDN